MKGLDGVCLRPVLRHTEWWNIGRDGDPVGLTDRHLPDAVAIGNINGERDALLPADEIDG